MIVEFKRPVSMHEVSVRLYVGPECAGTKFTAEHQAREATLEIGPDHGERFRVVLSAGYSQTLTFLNQLVEDAEAAIAWAQDMLCDHCEEDVREPDSRFCAECGRDAADEHRLADDLERLRDFRAEEAADRVARGAA
jgi:hypothetical protein